MIDISLYKRKIDSKYNKLYLTDLDRLWVEYNFYGRIESLIIIDLKSAEDGITPTEEGVYDRLKWDGHKIFIVYPSLDFNYFKIAPYKAGGIGDNSWILSSGQYADWLLQFHRYNQPSQKLYRGGI